MTEMTKRPDKVRILNMDVDNISMDELLEIREGTVLTLHVDMIAKLQKDREFYDIAQKFDVITCDSQILYFATKVLKLDIKERVSGSDMLPLYYTKWADEPDVTIFLCGAMGDISTQAKEKINAKVGREIIVGAYGPPSGFQDDEEEIERIIKMINESKASVLVVGVGAGLQEDFIMRYRDRFPHAKLFLPLGGTIDYEAGVVKRPPSWITTIGAEWLWRLIREPQRRWRRYLLHQPPVMYHLFMQAIGRYRNPFANKG